MEKEREILVLTKGQGRELIWGDLPDYETVSDDIVENTRWSLVHEIIVKRKSDGKFFRDYYREGATEMQEERPFENDDPDFKEVFPVEKTIIVYK
jgi:hypothetical protein